MPHRARRLTRAALAGTALTLVAALAGCTGSTSATAPMTGDSFPGAADPDTTYPSVPFSRVDDLLSRRVTSAGLEGAVLLVNQDGSTLHRAELGTVTADTVLPIGEAGRWLTAATVLSLVDAGLLGLDDPAGRYLPQLAPAQHDITVRQLLAHTSGLPDTVDCTAAPAGPAVPIGAEAGTPCDDAVSRATLTSRPGEEFRVSDAGYHVLARLAETIDGRAWPDVFRARIAEPLGLTTTRFTSPTGAEPGTTLLGSDAESSANDYGRFLAMILAGGSVDGTRVLSTASVDAMERDQTVRLDTHDEPWVGYTGVPTFGLGVWRDRLRGDDTAAMVSSPGRFGFYPWSDGPRGAWGVLALVDPTLPPGEPVRASATLVQGLIPPATDTEGRPLRRPGSTVAPPR